MVKLTLTTILKKHYLCVYCTYLNEIGFKIDLNHLINEICLKILFYHNTDLINV